MFSKPVLFAGLAVFLAACGFHLRGDPEVGIKTLYTSQDKPSAVHADLRRLLATGPTKLTKTPAEAEVHLKFLREAREKTVFTLTGAGQVFEFQLRLVVRYELVVPGREEPLIPSTEIEARRLVTYNPAAPTAKEAEEQLLYKDMQLDLARQILSHIAAVKRAQ